MSDITGERIEPAARVIEPQGPNPRGQADSGLTATATFRS